jgi:hypothetical protein
MERKLPVPLSCFAERTERWQYSVVHAGKRSTIGSTRATEVASDELMPD